MSVMLAIVAVWAILLLVFHGAMAIRQLVELLSGVDFDLPTFIMHVIMGFMFFLVALDGVLRMFTPLHTGLW